MSIQNPPAPAQTLCLINDGNPDKKPCGTALSVTEQVVGFTKRRGKKGSTASGGTMVSAEKFDMSQYKAQTATVATGYICRHRNKIPGLDITFCRKCSNENYPAGTYYVDADEFKFSLLARKAGLAIQSGTPHTPDVYEIFNKLAAQTTEISETHIQPSLFTCNSDVSLGG